MVVPVGESIADFNGAISLNETAAFLWRELQTETTRESLKDKLCDAYDVTEEKAYIDIDRFLDLLQQRNILEEE